LLGLCRSLTFSTSLAGLADTGYPTTSCSWGQRSRARITVQDLNSKKNSCAEIFPSFPFPKPVPGRVKSGPNSKITEFTVYKFKKIKNKKSGKNM
jgi:hypothetical protein